MNDREKRINEISRDMCFHTNCSVAGRCHELNCETTWLAEKLIDLNYQKIDKDSVVLTKSEKQKLLHEMYEQGRFDAIADLEKEGKIVISKEELEKLQSENKRLFYRSCNLILENQNIKEQTEVEKLCSNKELVEKIITCLADYKEYKYESISYKDWCVPHMVIKHIAKYFDIDVSKLNDKPFKKVLTFNGVKFEE